MKLNKDILLEDLKAYIRIDSDEDDNLLERILLSAKSFISDYTGLSVKELKEKESMYLAILVICSEMYDNRQYTVEKTNLNPIVKSILDMYSINLL